MNTNKDREYLTTEEAAAELNTSIYTIRRAVSSGRMDGIKMGKGYLISVKSIEAEKAARAGKQADKEAGRKPVSIRFLPDEIDALQKYFADWQPKDNISLNSAVKKITRETKNK